jgi:hypothetical protein
MYNKDVTCKESVQSSFCRVERRGNERRRGSSHLSTHTHTHSPVPSTWSVSCHLFASAPASRRPVSRQASVTSSSPCRPPLFFVSSLKTPWILFSITTVPMARSLLRLTSRLMRRRDEDEEQQQEQQAQDGDWSLSTAKRRKRGRKGKGMTLLTDHTQTSERLALAFQTLVRELSRQTCST